VTDGAEACLMGRKKIKEDRSKIFATNYTNMTIRVLSIAFSLAVLQYSTAYSQANKTISENFENFYNRFTSDSTFQISRVVFPLKGAKYYFDNDLKADSTPWIKDKWEFCTTNIYKIDTSKYKTNLLRNGFDIKKEVWIQNSGFFMERDFKLINGKWFQVYFLVTFL
jgi:hypothetical protein